MKKCPSCQKTFDDNMKFCQSDGTPLVVVAEEPSVDPYKTMVASDIKLPVEEPPAAEPAKPEPPAAPPPVKAEPPVAAVPEAVEEDEDDDVLEIPESKEPEDPLKTIVMSGSNTSDNIKVPDLPEKEPSAPATPAPPAPDAEPPGSEAATMITPEIPKFSEPDIKPPDLSAIENKPEKPKMPEPVSHRASDSEPSVPIPSPFDESMPPGMAPPEMPPFDKSNSTPDLRPLNEAPETPTPQVVEASSDPEPTAPPASPFADPGAPVNVPEPDSWDSPAPEVPAVQAAPAPDPFGNNSILNPPDPATGEEGENKTTAYISLGLGIASFVCGLGILGGIGALIAGYLAKKSIKENPAEYGGGTFATIGMVLGGLAVALTILLIGLWVLLVFSQGLS